MRKFLIILLSCLTFSEIYLEVIDGSKHPSVKASMYLTDTNNELITDISSSTFLVYEPQKQNFLSAFKNQDNLFSSDLIICLEMSASINSSKKEMILKIIQEINEIKTPSQQIKIIGFNDNVYTLQEKSSSINFENLEQFFFSSGTVDINQLFDNDHNGILSIAPTGFSKVLIISDGELNLNKSISDSLNKTNYSIYNVILESNISSSLKEISSKFYEKVDSENIESKSKIIAYNLFGYGSLEINWLSNNCDSRIQGNFVFQLDNKQVLNQDFEYTINDKISPLKLEENFKNIKSKQPGSKTEFEIEFELTSESLLDDIIYNEEVLTLLNAPNFDSLDAGEHTVLFVHTADGEPYSFEQVSLITNLCNRDVFYLTVGDKSEPSEDDNITIISPSRNNVYFPETELDVRWVGTNPLDSFRINIKTVSNNNSTNLKDNINGNRSKVTLPKQIGSYIIEVEHLAEAHNIRNVNSLGVEKENPQLVAFNDDSRLLAIYNEDRSVEVWDRNDSRREKVISNSINGVNDLSWSPVSEKLALPNSDGNRVLVYDLIDDEPLILSESLSEVNTVAWKFDEQQIVGGNQNGDLLIWTLNGSTPTLDVFDNITHNGENISSIEKVQWHPNGNLIFFLDSDGKLMVYNFEIQDFQFIQDLGNGNNFFKVSPTGDTLFVAGSNSSTGYSLLELDFSQDEIQTSFLKGSNLVKNFDYINWSPSSNKIAYNSGNQIRIFDIEEGIRVVDFNLHQTEINGLDIRNDFVVSFDQSQNIKVWNINLQNLRKVYDSKESQEFSIIELNVDYEDIVLDNICRNYSNFFEINNVLGNSSFIGITIDSIKVSENLKDEVIIENISETELERNQFIDISLRVESNSETNLTGDLIYYIEGKEFKQNLTVSFLESDYTLINNQIPQIKLDNDMSLNFDLFQNTSNNSILIDSVYYLINNELTISNQQQLIEPDDYFSMNLPLLSTQIGNYEARAIIFAFSSCTPIDIAVNYSIIAPRVQTTDTLYLVECDESNTFTYPITNSGNDQLLVNEITPKTSNIQVISFNQVIEPNEQGNIVFEINSSSGTFLEEIILNTNILDGLKTTFDLGINWKKLKVDFNLSAEQLLFDEENQRKEVIIENLGESDVQIDISQLNFFELESSELLINAGVSKTYTLICGEQDLVDEIIIFKGLCYSKTISLLSRFEEGTPILTSIDELIFPEIGCDVNFADSTINVENNGNGSLIVDNIYLTTGNFFSIESNYENPVLPSEEFSIEIRLEDALEFRNYDTLVIEYNSINTKKIPLECTYFYSDFTSNKSQIEFIDVLSNQEYSEVFLISNNGNNAETIELLISDPNFDFSENPINLSAGESKEITLTFLGGQPDDIISTSMDFIDNCNNNYSIPIFVNVIGNKYFIFEADDISANPDQIVTLNYSITNPNELELPENSLYSATVSFNKTLLTPINNNFIQTDSLTHFIYNSDLLDDINQQNSLDLLVSLGNDTSTTIYFQAVFINDNSFFFLNSQTEFSYRSDYIQNNPGPIFSSSINLNGPHPNPVFDEFEINFNLIENSNCKIDIVDASGRVLINLVNKHLQRASYQYSFDAIELSSGMYYLNFRAGNYQLVKPFIIFR